MHEYFGDFVVVDPHHFAVPIARSHTAMQVPSTKTALRFRSRLNPAYVEVHDAWCFKVSPVVHLMTSTGHKSHSPAANVTRPCHCAAALQLGLCERHRRGQPDDRGARVADALPQAAIRHQVTSPPMQHDDGPRWTHVILWSMIVQLQEYLRCKLGCIVLEAIDAAGGVAVDVARAFRTAHLDRPLSRLKASLRRAAQVSARQRDVREAGEGAGPPDQQRGPGAVRFRQARRGGQPIGAGALPPTHRGLIDKKAAQRGHDLTIAVVAGRMTP